MGGLLIILGVAVVMYVVNRLLRRAEDGGSFDPQSPSSAARPGLRTLFDYGPDGFGRDGSRQLPPPPDQARLRRNRS